MSPTHRAIRIRPRRLTAGAIVTTTAAVFAAMALTGSPATTAAPSADKAFPGAEGYGTGTPGGRGGTVCKVTNLKDSGAGSLRSCAEASGPRYVIFRVGGTIDLRERILVSDPFITIAGQTAPGGGITLRMDPGSGADKGPLKVGTHDVVIRYLRFRAGDGGGADDSHDGLSAYNSDGGVYNVVLDHNSISWAVDENLNTYYGVRGITISNNIISEALSHAGHPDGEHSKGYLAGGGSRNTSVHHNLFVSNRDRNPQISGVVNADLRNNVVYNYGDGSGDGVTLISSSKGEPDINWVNNYYKPGPDSPKGRAEFATYDGSTGATHEWFGEGNMRWTSSGDRAARVSSEARGRRAQPFAMAPVTTTSAAQAYTDVLAGAGASVKRDAVDQRLLDDVRNGTGRIIDDPSQVGGWPALARGSAPQDSDGDGMPDDFESQHGTDPNADDANGDKNGNGYTNIEDWFNGLVGGSTPAPQPTSTPSDPGPTATPSDPGPTATPSDPGPTATPSDPGPTATPSDPGPTSTPSDPGPTSTPSDPGPSSSPPGSPNPLVLVCPVIPDPAEGQEVVCTYQEQATP